MSLKRCRECGNTVSSSARVCPHCGKRNPTTSTTGWFVLIIIAVVCMVLIFSSSGSRTSRSSSSGSNTCYYCGGSGWVSNGTKPKDAVDFAMNHKTCPKCNGTGKLN